MTAAAVMAAVGANAQIYQSTGSGFGGDGNSAGDAVSSTATFNQTGTTLTITLADTSTKAAPGFGEVLYGFQVTGLGSATLTSVVAPSTDTIYDFGTSSTQSDGAIPFGSKSEWQQTSSPGGVSAIGDGQPDWGLISTTTTGLTGAHDPEVDNQLIFTFTGFTGSVSNITGVVFVWGTSDESSIGGTTLTQVPGTQNPAVPEASTMVAGLLMLLPLGIGTIRALRKERSTVKIS